MAGNVKEWVNDWYGENYYTSSPDSNPLGPGEGDFKVLRGGAWDDFNNFLRSAARNLIFPMGTDASIGFRCSRSP